MLAHSKHDRICWLQVLKHATILDSQCDTHFFSLKTMKGIFMRSNCREKLVVRMFVISLVPGLIVPATTWAAEYRCTLRDVMVFSNRVHAQCTTTTLDGKTNVRYFAVPTSDAKLADRLLTIGTTTLVSGRRFIAGYTSGDVSGNSFGCLPKDCRTLKYFGIE